MRILKISECKDCFNRKVLDDDYSPWVSYVCSKMNRGLLNPRNDAKIPEWCPLPEEK